MLLAKFSQIVTYYTLYQILKFIFHIEIRGNQNIRNIDLSKPLIIAANHTHFLDPIIGAGAFTEYMRNFGIPVSKVVPINFVAATEYFDFFKSPPFFPISLIVASYVRLNGSIPVLRGSKDKLEKKLKRVIDVLHNNGRIFIFPEGKITKDGHLQKGKRGIGYLHKTTKAPIIPVALINVYKCTKFKNLLLFLTGKKRIKIYIEDPIIDISNLKIEEIASVVMEKIKDLIKEDTIESSIKPLHNFETHNVFLKLIRLILIPIINNLPSKFLKTILQKTSDDSKPVLEKGGSTHALEVLYTIHNRRKEIFQKGFLHGLFTLFWHTILSQPKAIRNRLRLVEALLVETIKEKLQNKNNLEILSIGGGSCRAIIQSLDHLSQKENFNFKNKTIKLTNIDKHQDVLELTKKILAEHDLNFVKFEGIALNAKKITNFNLNKKFDIIEIVGLLDYFDDHEASNLLNYVFNNFLDQGGMLIWGNIRPNNEMKFLKNIGWPKMFYRNYQDIIKILKSAEIWLYNSKISIYTEPLQIHYIIKCRKI